MRLKGIYFLAVPVLLFCSAAGQALRSQADEPFALRAAKVMTGTGAVYDNGVILIRGGKIAAVGVDFSLPAGCVVKDLGPAVIVPGLVDADTALGAEGVNSEPVTALQPDASAEDVFNPYHDDFERALAAGITSVIVSPSVENVVGGTAVAVKTFGKNLSERVLRTGGPLVLTVDEKAFGMSRRPTSRVGTVDLLKGTIKNALAGDGDASPRLTLFAAGKLDGIFWAWHRYDIATALDLRKKYGLKLTLGGVSDAWEMMDDLKAAGAPLIMGPFGFKTPDRELRAPGRAAKAGLKIAFTAASPYWNPDYLRITAALAVRNGLDSETALRALTSAPAEITGIANRVGSLAPGKDADLAVFSGDPIDLTSRVLRVYVGGRLAYVGRSPPFEDDPDDKEAGR